VGGEDAVFSIEKKTLSSFLGKNNVFTYEVSNDNINKFKLMLTIWFSFHHYNNVKKIIINNNIDLVHVHNYFPLLTPGIFKAVKDCKCVLVHTLHNYRSWCISGILYRSSYGICELCANKQFSMHGIINRCYRKSFAQTILAQSAFWSYRLTNAFDKIDCYFVLSKFQKDKIKEFGVDENKVFLKPNFTEDNSCVCKNKNGYIFVGRLEDSKGVLNLLEVWSKLDQKYCLTLIGGGELEESLRVKYEKKNIIFKGKCSKEDTILSISKSKYLIQSSLLYETFGLTIIEAFICGVPVIGFDIGTRREMIENEVNGFLCSVDEFKNIIIKSYNYHRYEELSNNALMSSYKYSKNNVIDMQVRQYKKLIRRNLM